MITKSILWRWKVRSVMLLLVFLAVALVLSGVAVWLFWMLWCWVLPQMWPGGPQQIIQPDFWLFWGVVMLVGFVGRFMFPSRDGG